jgi:hypothetical protein
MRNTQMVVLFGSMVGVLLAGCGDDKPSRLSTGVDGSKPLGGTTPAEADAICKSTQTWAKQAFAAEKQKELTCRISSIGVAAAGTLAGGGQAGNDAQLRMACKTAYDQCMTAPATDPSSNPAMCQGFPSSCTATVAEYEACLNDVPPFVDQTVAMLPTCETVSQLSLLSLLAVANTLPPSCKTFQMKCGGAGGIPGIPGIPSPGGQP